MTRLARLIRTVPLGLLLCDVLGLVALLALGGMGFIAAGVMQ